VSDFYWLVKLYTTQFKNNLFSFSREKTIKMILMLLFGLMFFPVVYQLFYFIFKHFFSVPIIGGLLVNKVLSTFYLTFSVMIVLSSIVSAIPVLYFSRDMDFLFSAPVKTESIFTVQYVKIILDACWMIMLMAIPVFGAYMKVFKIDIQTYLFILATHIPFFIIMASIGILLTLILVKFFPAENIRNTAIAFFGIFIVAFVIYFRMLQPEKLTGAGLVEVSEFIKNMRTADSIFMPHGFFIDIIKKVTSSGIIEGLPAFFIFFTVSVAVFALVIGAARLFYFDGYAKKGVYKKEKPLPKNYRLKKRKLFFSQFSKDFKYLARDTTQWIQVVFLFGLVAIYLFNIYKLPVDLFNMKNLIYFLNIGFIGVILSAVGARFVLPVISTEGRGFWIFKAAPFSMAKYIIYKFLVYGILIIIIGQIVALLSIKILKSDEFINYVTIFSTFFITLVISGVGVGLGGYFADFGIKNPEDLITGVAGVVYMFAAILFVSVVLIIEAGMVKEYYMARMIKAKEFVIQDYTMHFCLIALFAIIITVAALAVGIHKLNKVEV